MDPGGVRIATAHAAAGVSAGVKAVTDRVRELLVTCHHEGPCDALGMCHRTTVERQSADLATLLHQIDAELGGDHA